MRSEQLATRPGLVPAYAASTAALVAVITELVKQEQVLAGEVAAGFGRTRMENYLSQPGLGQIIGARVLSEFGDDPGRYRRPRPPPPPEELLRDVTDPPYLQEEPGRTGRFTRNRRLADALHQQAFCALTVAPGVRAYYDAHRAKGNTHHQALRAVANRLAGILHGCLHHHTLCNEQTAWAAHNQPNAVAA